MVAKDELLKDLSEYLALEEEIIRNLSTFFQYLGWKNEVAPEDSEKIMSGLKSLQQDTQRHSGIIKDMLKYVEVSGKDEF
ncbi:MAG: hypothetical protein JW869_00885 [Candidatus Omnitrophica bacterium]|nr:hypothetical protein [Candidatus Omnitrophota bacterium]